MEPDKDIWIVSVDKSNQLANKMVIQLAALQQEAEFDSLLEWMKQASMMKSDQFNHHRYKTRYKELNLLTAPATTRWNNILSTSAL